MDAALDDNTFDVQNDEHTISTVSNCPVIGQGRRLNTLSTSLCQHLAFAVHVDVCWFIGGGLNETVTALIGANDMLTDQRIVVWGYFFNIVTFSNTLELGRLGVGAQLAPFP